MLISYPTDFSLPMTNIQLYTMSLQVFSKICTIFVGNWWKGNEILQRIDKIKAKYIISKVDDFLWLNMQMHDYFTTNRQNSELFFQKLAKTWMQVSKYASTTSSIFSALHKLYALTQKHYIINSISNKISDFLWLFVKITNFPRW